MASVVATSANPHVASPLMNMFGKSSMEELEASIIEMAKQSPADFAPLGETISSLITGSIMQDMVKQLASSQSEMNSLSQGFQLCDSSYPQPNVASFSAAHLQCRQQEATLYTQWSAACLTTVPQLASIYYTNCMVNLKSMSNILLWPTEVPANCAIDQTMSNSAAEQKFQDMMNYFQDKLNTWNQTNQLCQQAKAQSLAANATCQQITGTYKNQTLACSKAQQSMDDAYCQGSLSAQKFCPLKQQCYKMAQTAFLQHNSTIAAEEAGLQSTWKMLSRIYCMVRNILDNTNNDCTNANLPTSTMSINYLYFDSKNPRMPDVSTCSSPSVPQPGTDGYVQTFYNILPANAPADACTSKCCTTCSFFTDCGASPLRTNAASLTGWNQGTCCEQPCTVTAPDNGSFGSCPATLQSRASCTPACAAGYSLNGTVICSDGNATVATCQDINECTTFKANCDPHAQCANTIGSYTCTCLPGYVGNGLQCNIHTLA
jgi:hypothetical protein